MTETQDTQEHSEYKGFDVDGEPLATYHLANYFDIDINTTDAETEAKINTIYAYIGGEGKESVLSRVSKGSSLKLRIKPFYNVSPISITSKTGKGVKKRP